MGSTLTKKLEIEVEPVPVHAAQQAPEQRRMPLWVIILTVLIIVGIIGFSVYYYGLRTAAQTARETQTASVATFDNSVLRLHHEVRSVSYTHLTLPTIYSV
eukprot:TRINITY_DN6997_c0_g1_i1.p1 TRINITY_DN6997_c0_g1~~TRINITY_DN6997_c0_g1_i1.p1  ORF type:complete len:101 (-),score=4.26 TRINITY_DN6997_c0_g1_i1:33-335(-)